MAIPYIKRLRDNATADFVSLRPIDPQTSQPVIEPVSRPNIDDYSFRKLAKKGEPWRVRAVRDFPTLANARAAVQNLRNGLIGELCDVVTREVTTFGRMMCLKVTELEVREVSQVVGGLGGTGGSSIFSFSEPTTLRGLATVEIVFVHASAPADEGP